MRDTDRYYDQHAQMFFESTAHVDMAPLRQRFLTGLAPGSHLLDAGCGSGRDARAFAAQGFRVSAFDASPALAELAARHCNFPVAVRRFEEIDDVDRFDGIWCCASLLHVAETDMPDVLGRLWRALRPGGVMYLSFKLGRGMREHQGRRFTDADEPTLRGWLSALAPVQNIECWQTEDVRPERRERWINALVRRAPQRLITGGDHDPLLGQLSAACALACEVDLAVSFVKASGLRLLLADLETVARHPRRRLRILTSDYLGITDPEALKLLMLLQEQGAEVRVHETRDRGFHLKAYVFSRLMDGRLIEGTAFVGSSNISRQALTHGLEWNYRVVHPGDSGFLEIRQRFDELFAHPNNAVLSDTWIEDYVSRRQPPTPRLKRTGTGTSVAPEEDEPPAQPHAIQQTALAALADTRRQGWRRGLVVLATGLGKTWLAAFDAQQMDAQRILFVAHRDEILNQAAATFLRVRPRSRVGFYNGRSRDIEADLLFASIQTLGRTAHLDRFPPTHFDYIVIDEFHHAAAPTYRRVLAHFSPTFLLGLTATPDRTDQSDILTLCDDNLVHVCPMFDGIQAGLLAPFHYYGIHDEAVDYREIPWRNGQFDPEALSHRLATQARAHHAHREWRARSQQRTLAFCVSRTHADFMAAHFRREGIAAAAVYSDSAWGRAQALEQLESGALQVLFSVDLFNEGLDVPGIDTVMMLRPTESRILFLQQLGRGLRRHEGKSHLVVLDFIGNHQAFLRQPQALFGIEPTHEAMTRFALEVEQKELALPPGCFVNYDLRVIDFLKSLGHSGSQEAYATLRNALGRRPTLTEYHRAGASLTAMRKQHGHWFALVKHMADLSPTESAILEAAQTLLREVEITAMTRSFKMVLLEAFLELDGLRTPVDLTALARRSREVLERRRVLLTDLSDDMRQAPADSAAWASYWRRNLVQAWIGDTRSGGHFRLDGSLFALNRPLVPEQTAPVAEWLQELVDFRLATYANRQPTEAQGTSGASVIALPTQHRSTGTVIPFFPDLKIACGHFRAARTEAVEQRWLPASYGVLDPERHFIAPASGHSMDGGKHPIRDGDLLLLELITPQRAGSITGSVMAIERQDDSGDNQYLLRVVSKNAAGQYILKAQNPDYADLPATDDMRTLARLRAVIDPLDLARGQSFMREEIPALFGDQFNPGKWNVGHVTLPSRRAHVLLVTLNKQGKAEEHRYIDHWIDDHTFQWQSQNSTTPSSSRGQEIIQHAALGITVHLFVRDHKLAEGKAAPFVYHGPAVYRSHQGSAPMSVIFDVETPAGCPPAQA